MYGKGVEVYSDKSKFDGNHGIMAYNKTKQRKHKANQQNNITDWIVAVGKHKGFISGKDWIKVQKILEMNKTKSYRKPQKNTALLAGIITCKECGSRMRPRISTNRFDKNGEQKYVYSCTLKEKSRGMKCNGKNIDGNMLDKLLMERIKQLIAPNEKICRELKNIINTKSTIVDENDEYLILKTKYDNNQKSLDSLIQKIKYVDIDLIDDINKEVKKIKKENETIKEQLDIFEENKNLNKYEVDVAKIVLEIIESHFEQFDSLDLQEKKALLRLIINSATGNGDTVEFNLLTDKSSDFLKTNLLPLGEYSK